MFGKLFCLIVIINVTWGRNLIHPLSHEFINKINQLQQQWRAGHNFPEHTSLEYIKGLMGVKLHVKTERLPLKQNDKYMDRLPEHFDAREHWPKCDSIKHVRDQGSCGSCWAVAAVEAISDRICIHSNQTQQVQISADHLMSCNLESDGCDGGWLGPAWSFWVQEGIVTGGDYNSSVGCQPYPIPSCEHHTVGTLPQCNKTVPTPLCKEVCFNTNYKKSFDNDLYFGKTSYAVMNNELAIRNEIFKNGPVEAAFSVYEDFISYKSGVYQYTHGQFLGGHAIKILGWGVENNVPYWLAVNSWNEDWGDKGFFKIKRGTDDCGIESDIAAGIPKHN